MGKKVLNLAERAGLEALNQQLSQLAAAQGVAQGRLDRAIADVLGEEYDPARHAANRWRLEDGVLARAGNGEAPGQRGSVEREVGDE